VRSCASCGAGLEPDSWRCSSCGAAPREVDGIQAFLSDADTDGAFSGTDYSNLEQIESASFWFRARNELIQWALRDRFPGARRLLEVGCGTGYVLAGLERAFPELELSGSELSLDALRIARDRLERASLYQFDARAIPFRDEFDVVCAFDVLEHIEQDDAVLKEMRAAAGDGGGLLITVPQHRWLWSASDEYGGHQRRYSRGELLGKLRAAGFKEVLVTSFATAVLPLMAASRLRSRLWAANYDPTEEHVEAQRVDAVLDRLMRIDLALIRRRRSLRVGGSLLVAAKAG
jgi:ubiquinone/menaquinone biosynthesis C-methylase UbiE